MLDVLADTYRIATRMEAFEAPRPVPATQPRPAPRALPYRPNLRTPWLWRALRRVSTALQAWRDRARAREDVLRMSEHQLRDIGLTRHEALRAVDGR